MGLAATPALPELQLWLWRGRPWEVPMGPAGCGRKPGPTWLPGPAGTLPAGVQRLRFASPGPRSPAPGRPAQNLSLCPRQIRRSFHPLLGPWRRTKSPRACWFLTSRRSGSGVWGVPCPKPGLF